MISNYFNLAEILEESPIVVDTCALIGSLSKRTLEREIYPNLFSQFLNPNQGVYTCPKVIGEYSSIPEEEIRLRRLAFIADLINAGGLLHFSGRGNHLYCDYYKKIRDLAMKRGIHQTDLDVLASASTLGANKGQASIISNDFPLMQTWSEACSKRVIDPNKVHFFVREDTDVFRRAYVK